MLYTANDGQLDSEPETAYINVEPVNDNPEWLDVTLPDGTDLLQAFNEMEDFDQIYFVSSLEGIVQDVDGDTLQFSSYTENENIFVWLNNDNDSHFEMIITASQNYFGQADIFVIAQDQWEASDTTLVTLNIVPVNDTPEFNLDISYCQDFHVFEDDSLYFPNIAYDVDEDELLYQATYDENIDVFIDGGDLQIILMIIYPRLFI